MNIDSYTAKTAVIELSFPEINTILQCLVEAQAYLGPFEFEAISGEKPELLEELINQIHRVGLLMRARRDELGAGR